MIGEQRWVWATLGAIFLIFSIHFSPRLRRIFSYHHAVFFGSISFPVYLIHSFFMRTVLVWIIHGFIPQTLGFMTYVYNAIGMIVWMALLIRVSMFWRDRIDGWCAVFTEWIEDVMLGKKSLMELAQAILEKVPNLSRGAQPVDTEQKESKV
jgi:peptidoglycan/LPS O-acetylase OafA/YrhL